MFSFDKKNTTVNQHVYRLLWSINQQAWYDTSTLRFIEYGCSSVGDMMHYLCMCVFPLCVWVCVCISLTYACVCVRVWLCETPSALINSGSTELTGRQRLTHTAAVIVVKTAEAVTLTHPRNTHSAYVCVSARAIQRWHPPYTPVCWLCSWKDVRVCADEAEYVLMVVVVLETRNHGAKKQSDSHTERQYLTLIIAQKTGTLTYEAWISIIFVQNSKWTVLIYSSTFLKFLSTQSSFTLHVTFTHSHTFIHWWQRLPGKLTFTTI